MALRIAEPTPLRAIGFGAAAGGTLVTIMSGFQGPGALVGLGVLSVGIALLDAVDAGRVGWRQLGVFLLSLGAVLTAWALAVTLLLAMLGLPLPRVPLMLLAGGTLAVGVGIFLTRYLPRPAPAIVADRPSATAIAAAGLPSRSP
jgi:hypothetical protein